jgi:alpha-methylacyl-CoA racemase
VSAGPVTGPLAGLRIVEIGGIGPGPFAGMMLSDLGAEVVRVDRPGVPLMGPPDERHNTLHRGRRSVLLDTRGPAGLDALLQLVDRADAVIEAARPGVAERVGFGPEVCLTRNPKLVYARMTGWGQEGPLAGTAGHDLTYIARTGALHAIGVPDTPTVPLNLIGDFGGGGAFCVIGIVSALLHAQRSGVGQVVDAAIVDGTALLTTGIRQLGLSGLWSDERASNLMDGGCPWYAVYGTSDHRHVAVAALEPKFYAELLRGLDVTLDLARDDPRNWTAIRTALAERFASAPLQHWTAVFDQSDACVAPVRTFDEAAHDPQLAARATYVEVDGVLQPAPAPRFSVSPPAVQCPPPRAGADTRAVLEDWGVGDVTSLVASGAAVEG